MGDASTLIISTVLSSIIFRFLLFFFNSRICGIFTSIQKDLDKISKINRCILYCTGYILSISITINFAIYLEENRIISGLILGFMMALVDICFSRK